MKAPANRVKARIREIKRTIEVWQKSNSLSQAAKRLKVSENVLTSRITRYRLCGVPLQYFGHSTRQPEIDWEYFALYAEQMKNGGTTA